MARDRRRTRVILEGGETVAVAAVADHPLSRTIGLLTRSHLDAGDGLIIDPCHSIHTWFMRFAIDVLFLDDGGRVVRLVEALPPFRFASGRPRARVTVELPAGTIRRAAIAVGARLGLEPA